jgi:hypothetical protein
MRTTRADVGASRLMAATAAADFFLAPMAFHE